MSVNSKSVSSRLLDHDYELFLMGSENAEAAAVLQRLFAQRTPALMSEATKRAFDLAVKNLFTRHDVIRAATEGVRERFHEKPAQKILDEADIATQTGLRAEGRDATENFKDALFLIRNAQKLGVGARDFKSWFDAGWLTWKIGADLGEAEEAFYQAARLSATLDSPFHSYSLRHLAYMQSLQDREEAAFETIEKALVATPNDAEIFYDAARYAAKIGRLTEASTFLQKSLRQNPLIMASVQSEPYFTTTPLAGEINQLQQQQTDTLLAEIRAEIADWQSSIARVEAAFRHSGGEDLTPLSELLSSEAVQKQLAGQAEADYFAIAEQRDSLRGKADAVVAEGVTTLENLVTFLEGERNRPQTQMDKLSKDKTLWEGTLQDLEEEARQAGFPLTRPTPMVRLQLRMQKLDKRADAARLNYLTCQQNLQTVRRRQRDEMPKLQEAVAEASKRFEQAQAALDSLRGGA